MAADGGFLSAEERRRRVIRAIVDAGGDRECAGSDQTAVADFFPGRELVPEAVLERIRTAIERQCGCPSLGPVTSRSTVGQLQRRVYRKLRRREQVRTGAGAVRTSCTEEEIERGIIAAIGAAGGQTDRPCSDLTEVIEFFPGQTSLPEVVLERIRDEIRRRCWCREFGPVQENDTVAELCNSVYTQHMLRGGPVKQPDSPDECCS